MINCKNCGAPLLGDVCEYCGSRVRPENTVCQTVADKKQYYFRGAITKNAILTMNEQRKQYGLPPIEDYSATVLYSDDQAVLSVLNVNI